MQSRPFLSFVSLAAVLAATTPSHAEPYQAPARFGLGLELGAPTGLSGKYFLGGGMVAIQGGVGIVESWGDDGVHAHVEVVWHFALLKRTPAVEIPLYAGVGGRVLQHRFGSRDRCFNGRFNEPCMDGDTHVGIRAPFGISFVFRRVPMDLFVELAVLVDVAHLDNDFGHDHDHAGVSGVLGGRYYF